MIFFHVFGLVVDFPQSYFFTIQGSGSKLYQPIF